MNETETLRGLIAKARRERGTSVRQLALQAKAADFKIVGTTLNAIENGTYKSEPSDETLRAIAWLAGVGSEVAFMAAGRRLPGPPFADELPPGVDALSPKEREAVIGLLRVLIAQRQEIQGYDEITQPGTQESSPKHSGTGSSPSQSGASNTRAGNAGAPDKPDALIAADQGKRVDYELVGGHRLGKTQRQWELEHEPQAENESQDTGSDEPA